jgi:hypothetical protein
MQFTHIFQDVKLLSHPLAQGIAGASNPSFGGEFPPFGGCIVEEDLREFVWPLREAAPPKSGRFEKRRG